MGALHMPPRYADGVDDALPEAPEWLRELARDMLARRGLKPQPPQAEPIIQNMKWRK